jgi:acetyl esterase/lipase
MLKRIGMILFAGALAGTAHAQQLDPATKWATTAQTEFKVTPNIVYQKANNVELHLDLITTGKPIVPRATVVYIHGGGWVEGTKEDALLRVLAYLPRGMNVINVEYRMAPESLAPAAVEDCRCALHWVYDHAAEYGVDTSKIVVVGHSAGGHLALMTGLLDPSAGYDNGCRRLSNEWREGSIRDVKVAAIVNFYGPTDLPKILEEPTIRNFAVRWFGSLPDRIELAKRLSPINYVRANSPPVITIMGDKDPIVPYSQGVELHEILDRAGVANQFVTIKGGGHGTTAPYEWTRDQVLEAQSAVFSFLEKHGVIAPNP